MNEDPANRRWQLALQIIGAGAAIGAWIAVVGGARLWAQLDMIDVPASFTVSTLPRELLLAEGFRTLAVPMLLGGVVAGVVYFTRAASADVQQIAAALPATDAGGAVTQAREATVAAFVSAEQAIGAVYAAWRAAASVPSDGPPQDTTAHMRYLDQATAQARQAVATAANDAQRACDLTAHAQGLVNGNKKASDRLKKAHDELSSLTKRMDRGRGELDTVRRAMLSAPPAKRADVARGQLEQPAREPLGTDVAIVIEAFDKAQRAIVGSRLRQLAQIQVARKRWDDLKGRRLARAAWAVGVFILVVVSGAVALSLVKRGEWDPWPMWRAGLSVLVAGLVLFGAGWWLARFRDPEDHKGWAPVIGTLTFIGVILIPAAPLVALWVGFYDVLPWNFVGYVLLLSVGVVWLAVGAMARWSGAGATAWILFAAIALWSGALAFIGDVGAKHNWVESVVVKRKSVALSLTGFYLGRTAKHVYIAEREDDLCQPATDPERRCRRVLSIPDADVGCLVFGPDVRVPEKSRVVAMTRKEYDANIAHFGAPGQRRADPCGPKPTPSPTAKPAVTSVESSAGPVTQSVTVNVPPTSDTAAPPSSTLVLRTDVTFAFNRARLSPTARARLRAVAAAIKRANPPTVYLVGHADSIGRERRNKGLSERRARRAGEFLNEAIGRGAPHMEIDAAGEASPASCEALRDGSDDGEGRAYNRRVEITVDETTTEPPAGCAKRSVP